MIYSCFDAHAGLYQYFEDEKGHQVNGDLPVPSFRGDAGRIGVASIEAARPFPRGARPAGRGWRARGVIVRCPRQSSTTLSGFDGSGVSPVVVGSLVLFGLFALYAWRTD